MYQGGGANALALLKKIEELETEIESLKMQLKLVNIVRTEITSNNKTVNGATEFIKWIFPDGTAAQLSANPSGIQLMTYDGVNWNYEWKIETKA